VCSLKSDKKKTLLALTTTICWEKVGINSFGPPYRWRREPKIFKVKHPTLPPRGLPFQSSCPVCSLSSYQKTQLYTFSQSISTSQQTRTSTVSGIVTTPGYRNSRASNRLVAMQTRKFGSVARSLRSGKPALRFRGHESGTDCNIHLLIRSSCPSSESATRQWRSHEDIPRKKAAVLFPKLIITSNSNLFLHL